MEIFYMFLAVVVMVMLVGQPWRKRGRNSGSSGYFPWTGSDNSSGGLNHHHGHAHGGGHGGGDGDGHGGH